jgi:hypothetical protein
MCPVWSLTDFMKRTFKHLLDTLDEGILELKGDKPVLPTRRKKEVSNNQYIKSKTS